MNSKKPFHRARKRFGQNFLTDLNIQEKIIVAMAPGPEDKIIEIGPGQGALTEKLLQSAGMVHAIEIDRDLSSALLQQFGQFENFRLHEGDVLKFDFNTLLSANEPARIIGNLPYNISSPLIFHLLKFLPGIIDMLFMLQLEVVERMTAAPGSKNYGRLSIMIQYYCEAELLFRVPPTAFIPAPKVESAIVKLLPRPSKPFQLNNPEILASLVRQAFSQRRKTLRNNLKGLLSDEELENLDADPALRAENLSPEDYVRIAGYLEKRNS